MFLVTPSLLLAQKLLIEFFEDRPGPSKALQLFLHLWIHLTCPEEGLKLLESDGVRTVNIDHIEQFVDFVRF